MSAAAELQAAVVAVLAGLPDVSGVFDAPPPGTAFPYVTIGEGLVLDWSTKTEAGREHRVALTAWDEAGRTARLLAIADGLEAAMAALPADLPSHRIAGVALIRSRIIRTPGGPWAAMVEHRVRTRSR